MAKDYYKVLGVAQNATKEDIKKAYRGLAHKFHPDKGGDEQRFKEINEAYRVLSNEPMRAQYDQFGRVFEGGGAGPQQGGFEWPGGFRFDFGGLSEEGGRGFGDFDFSEVFEDFFTGGGRRKAEKRGRDVRADIEIAFEESILGTKKEVDLYKLMRCERCGGSGGEKGTAMKQCGVCGGKGNVQRTQRTLLGSFTQVATCVECVGTGKRPETVCAECRGRGVFEKYDHVEIVIPKGMRDGEMLKMTGRGEASVTGGIPGDLYLHVHVLAHKNLRRQGDDIVMKLPIKLSQAILGDIVAVDMIEGALRVKIPEGTQSGDILKVRGKGAHTASGYGRGDLLIEIKVEIPRKLSRKLRGTIETLKEEGL